MSTPILPVPAAFSAAPTPKKPAPLILRALAFLADALLVLFATFVALKFLIPQFWGTELKSIAEDGETLWNAYVNAIASGANPNSLGNLQPLAQKFGENPALGTLLEACETISLAVAFSYFLLTEYFGKGASLGKKIFRLRTISQLSGTPPCFLQCFSRSIWRACTIAPPGIIIGLIALINAHVPFFSSRRHGWHDRLSRTEVIDDKENVPAKSV